MSAADTREPAARRVQRDKRLEIAKHALPGCITVVCVGGFNQDWEVRACNAAIKLADELMAQNERKPI